MSWILLENDDGTYTPCEEANPDPAHVLDDMTADEIVEYCNKQIAQINREWQTNPMHETESKSIKQPIRFELSVDMLQDEYRAKESFNSEVNRHNEKLAKWQSLKDAALAK